MIEIKDKQILIDGEPRIIISGEVHYFRLRREEWQDRIDKLKASGCNAAASYVPWLSHEFYEGRIDLEGKTRPELNLGGFIDLCKDNGLYFFVRPGPFIMAEMKNEGIPYWVYKKHPEIEPVTWDGKPAPTRTIDYLAPGFLQEARHWYEAVMPVIVPRLQPNGGNIIGVQLDNEIGMLSWVSNSPDLTDNLLSDFTEWLQRRYDADTLKVRYPFVLDNAEIRNTSMRSPKEEYAAHLMRDLGHYMRDRFARYARTLAKYAEDLGVRGVPLIINVHGTDAGRGLPYPIGISQLCEAYTQEGDFLAGSDHYLGELGHDNFQDLYLINALMDAVNRPEQPLTSVEFEAGSGDYGDNLGKRYDPSTVDHKVRMCVAQGNRLINYYLFTGGINTPLPEPVHDGNDRIAFTGERHGFAAPVNPEGRLNYSYRPLANVTKAMLAVGDKLAVMHEERDGVSFGFIPDYYMTESRYRPSARMSEIVANLEENRGRSAWESVARAMLLGGYRFGAVDVQNRPLDPRATPVLVLPSARYMDGEVQHRLVDYLQAGGKVLLYGEVPQADMEGNACTVLAEALGLKLAGARRSETFYFLSVWAEGWLAPRPEIRSHRAQFHEPSRGEVILRAATTGEACGFDIPMGQGRAIVISADYTCDISLFRDVLGQLGATPALTHDYPQYGIFMTSSASPEGERFLHIINLDGFDKEVRFKEHGRDLFEGRMLTMRRKEGVTLPLNVSFGDVRIAYSTAEIASVGANSIEFRLTQPQDTIALDTARKIVPSSDYSVELRNGLAFVTSRKHAALDDRLTVRWE